MSRKTGLPIALFLTAALLTGCLGGMARSQREVNAILDLFEKMMIEEDMTIPNRIFAETVTLDGRQYGKDERNALYIAFFQKYDVIQYSLSDRRFSSTVRLYAEWAPRYSRLKDNETGETFETSAHEVAYILEKIGGNWLVVTGETAKPAVID